MSDSTRHTGETDEVHTIELPSAIEQVSWSRGVSSPGGEVGLGVFTQYVGNGAELQIELSDNAGKKIASFKEKLAGNRSWLNVRIPKDAREALFADVKLPKHGLSKRSPALLLTPPIEITDVKWDKDVLRRGDAVKLSASVEGAPDGMEAEISIFEHDEDGAHELVTKFPTIVQNGKVEAEWEFQYSQDTGRIPTFEEVVSGYAPPRFFFRASVGGGSADSSAVAFHDWIDITLADEDGSPVPDMEYVVKFADGSERRDRLNGEGKAREDDVPPGPYFVSFPDIGDDLTVNASEFGQT